MIFDTSFTCQTCWESHPYCKSCYKLCGMTHYIYSVKNLNPENCPYVNGYNDQWKCKICLVAGDGDEFFMGSHFFLREDK